MSQLILHKPLLQTVALKSFFNLFFLFVSVLSFSLITLISSILIFNNVSVIFSSTILGISISSKKCFLHFFFISFSFHSPIIVFCKILSSALKSCLNRTFGKFQNSCYLVNMISFTIKRVKMIRYLSFNVDNASFNSRL